MYKWKNILLSVVIALPMFCKDASAIAANDNDTWISKTAQEACIKYGEEYGICPELLMAMIETESSGQPAAENDECKGLMQVNPKWHEERMERLGVSNVFDEKGNILVGTDYLAELLEEYREVCLALDKYNGNSKAEYNAEHGIMSDYSHTILTRSEELERLHGK